MTFLQHLHRFSFFLQSILYFPIECRSLLADLPKCALFTCFFVFLYLGNIHTQEFCCCMQCIITRKLLAQQNDMVTCMCHFALHHCIMCPLSWFLIQYGILSTLTSLYNVSPLMIFIQYGIILSTLTSLYNVSPLLISYDILSTLKTGTSLHLNFASMKPNPVTKSDTCSMKISVKNISTHIVYYHSGGAW